MPWISFSLIVFIKNWSGATLAFLLFYRETALWLCWARPERWWHFPASASQHPCLCTVVVGSSWPLQAGHSVRDARNSSCRWASVPYLERDGGAKGWVFFPLLNSFDATHRKRALIDAKFDDVDEVYYSAFPTWACPRITGRGSHVQTQTAGPHPQTFWLSGSGVGPKNLPFSPVLR